MTRVIGGAMLVGLFLWIIVDPTVLVETIHTFFCRCLNLDDEHAKREHERAMDALDRIGGRR